MAIAFLPVLIRAQQPAAPQPLNMTIPQVNGTGAISGVVTDVTTKKPLAGVVVYLGPPNRGPVGQPIQQLSDAQGRFVFRDLPSSDAYFINASKFGYFDGHVGRAAGGQLGARISVADGQWVNDANIVMARSGALSGTVTDELGDPLVGAFMRAIPEVLISGQPQLVAGSVTTTDDRGVYRISGLVPGKYLIFVPIVQESVPAAMSGLELAGQTAQSAAAATAAGRQVPTADPAMAVDPNAHLMLGRYVAGPAPAAGRPRAYAPMFYPSARSAGGALAIELTSGEDRSGLDIRLEPVSVSRISGVVQAPPEALAGLTVRLLLPGTEDLGDGSEAATALADAHGAFTFLNVPAGSYTIAAQRSVSQFEYSSLNTPTKPLPRPLGSGGYRMSSTLVMAAPSGTRVVSRSSQGDTSYFGRTRVSVGDRDVTDVVVTLQRGVSIIGRVVWEDTPPVNPVGIIAMAEPAHGQASLGYPRKEPTSAEMDTFRIDGLLQGEYLLRFLGVGGSIKSIMWDGRDYSNRPFDASAGRDFTDVVITMTTQTILLAGTVHDDKGAVSKTAAVLVFPVEQDQWSAYGFSPTRIKAATVNSAGLYRFASLPAGRYYVIAVDDSQVDAWQDPKFLATAAATATRVTLDWGGRVTQDLVLKK